MTLFILTETSAGYALLKARDKKLLKRDVAAETQTAEGVCSLLKLKQFRKFDSAATALDEVASIVEGKVTPMLASLLDTIKEEKKVDLAVADPKLANAIKKLPQLSIKTISDSTTADLYRAIRGHLPSLIPGLVPEDISTMSLGLSHSLSRHKLKFSPDKVDTMIIQAIALLDDLDKELNQYAMRVKEWYGWHFPEMAKIINDNLAYARVILKMGVRSNSANADLADILPEEIEGAVKAAAEISMGTEITSEDLDNIQALAQQVVDFTEYRQQLSAYLSARMQAIAPNLTILVGELVGARLIAHAGSLMNLSKSPASTIQILGAEKALFRALKTKHDTPKYGLIYHASLVGQATGKNKGKIARILAAKAALGLRVDSLADWGANGKGTAEEPTEEEKTALGHEARLKVEARLRALEGKPLRPQGVAIGPGGQTQPGKWEVKEARKYNRDADGLVGDEPAAAEHDEPLMKPVSTKRAAKEKPVKQNPVDVRRAEEANGAAEEEDEDEEEDEQEPQPDEEETIVSTNLDGTARRELTKAEKKQEKEARREAKRQRKLERAAKRDEKAAKKAAKEARKQGEAADEKVPGKKRKRDEVEPEKEGKSRAVVANDEESSKKRKRDGPEDKKKKKKKRSKDE